MSVNANIKLNTASYKVFAWFNFLVPALFFGYEYLLRVLPSILFTTLHQHFHGSAVQMSFVLSWYYYAYALMQIPAGLLVDRFGARFLVATGLLLCMMGSFIFITADHIWSIGIARILMGLGGAFSFVSCVRLICVWFAPRQFAFLTGIAVMIGASGAIFAHITVAPSIRVLGIGQTFIGIFAIGVILLLIALQFIREPESARSIQLPAEKRYHKAILANKILWVLALYAFLLTAPTSSFAALWGASFLANTYQLNMSHSASYIALVFMGWVIGAPLFSWLGCKQKQSYWLMGLAALFSSLMLLTILLFKLPTLLSLGVALFGFGFFSAAVVLSYTNLRAVVTKEQVASAGGFVNLFAMLAAVFAQPLIGLLLDLFSLFHQHAWQTLGLLNAALMILPVFQVMAMILIFSVRPKNKQNLISDST